MTIARALPPGAQVARTHRAWLQAVEEHPATAQLRADAHEHLLAIAGVLARSADRSTQTSRPTWDRLCDLTGLGRRTVARWLAWLRSAGLLGVVESGSTPDLRPMALAHLEGNRAALYVLAQHRHEDQAAASVDESGTPSFLTEGESPLRTRSEGETSPLRGPDSRKAATRSSWRWTAATTHGRNRLACVQRLQERVPALRPLSERHLRHLLRPWLVAGWTAADLVYALDHDATGSPHTWTTSVRSPKGWLRHRLGQWTDAAGLPVRPPSAITADRVDRTRAEQAARRVEITTHRDQAAAEAELGARLQALASARWQQLLARFARGRRHPGPMSEAQARAAVRAELARQGAGDAADETQLLAALETALAVA